MKCGYRLRLKAYIDQKDEFVVLEHIAKLLNVFSVILWNKTKSFYRVEIQSKAALPVMINYLDTFLLPGKKKEAYIVW